jgi:hypothetical protein
MEHSFDVRKLGFLTLLEIKRTNIINSCCKIDVPGKKGFRLLSDN